MYHNHMKEDLKLGLDGKWQVLCGYRNQQALDYGLDKELDALQTTSIYLCYQENKEEKALDKPIDYYINCFTDEKSLLGRRFPDPGNFSAKRDSNGKWIKPYQPNTSHNFLTKWSILINPYNLATDNGVQRWFMLTLKNDSYSKNCLKSEKNEINKFKMLGIIPMYYNYFTTRGELKTFKGKVLESDFSKGIGDLVFPQTFLLWDYCWEYLTGEKPKFKLFKQFFSFIDSFLFHWALSYTRKEMHNGSTAGTLNKWYNIIVRFKKKDIITRICWWFVYNGKFSFESMLHKYYIDGYYTRNDDSGRVPGMYNVCLKMIYEIKKELEKKIIF